MMVDVLSVIEDAGLTKNEAIVYTSILKHGKMTKYAASKASGIFKANAYQAVDRLIQKNLLTQYEENKKVYITANPPEYLVRLIDAKKEQLQSIIPMITQNIDEELISVSSGVQAFFSQFYALLPLNSTIYAYDIPAYVPDMIKTHIMIFHAERIKRKIDMYHVYDYDAGERIDILKKMKHTYAIANKTKRHSLTTTLVCGDITLIINWKKNVKVIRIKDADLASTYKQQFDALWKDK